MIKALKKNVQLRMSEAMHGTFEGLAKLHGVPVSRLIRASLWTFLLEEDAHRQTGSAFFAEKDEALKASLVNLDWLDVGVKSYPTTGEGHKQEEADWKNATEDDGVKEQ